MCRGKNSQGTVQQNSVQNDTPGSLMEKDIICEKLITKDNFKSCDLQNILEPSQKNSILQLQHNNHH
jgi:hypothetical protein